MKNVLILGAGSEIAQACAHSFARDGKSLTLASRKTERLEEIAADIRIRHSCEVAVRAFDALATDSHQEFYKSLPQPPGIVICAFGYLGEQEQAQSDFAQARRIIDTNYSGAVSILEVIAADFAARGAGAIVGIGSVAGDRGRQSNYIYGSAKGAFAIYLAGLRNRMMKSGVHVLTVKPGFVDTKMTAGMDLPPLLTAQAERVAEDIRKAVAKRRNIIYSFWIWRYIMLVIRSVPEAIFKRLSM